MTSETQRLLNDPSIRRVLDTYADGVRRCRNVDILGTRGMVSANILRSIRSFIGRYGVDNACGIVATAFNMTHMGFYNGRPVGDNLFTIRFDWMARMLLQEYMENGMSPDRDIRSYYA